jgi:predicted ester cyclase
MTRADLHDIAERYLAVWKQHDAAGVALFHAADSVAESPMYATLRGRKAVEQAALAFVTSFPDVAFEVDAQIVDPPQIAMFLSANATHMNDFFGLPGTNRHIDFRVAWLIRLNADSLIEYERRIYDFTGVLLQLGVLRAKPMKP